MNDKNQILYLQLGLYFIGTRKVDNFQLLPHFLNSYAL